MGITYKTRSDEDFTYVKYTDTLDLTPYHLSNKILDELNNLYQKNIELAETGKQNKNGITLVPPDCFTKLQNKWTDLLPDICILWGFNEGNLVGYFYSGLCEGMLIVIEPATHTVTGVYRNYKSFSSILLNLSDYMYRQVMSGDYPDVYVDSDMQKADHTLALQLCSMLESQSNYLTKRLLACMVTKIMPHQRLGELEGGIKYPDPYVQVSLFQTLRYYKFMDALEWLESLLQQEKLAAEVQREAQLTYDMLRYPGTFEQPVTVRGEYKRYNSSRTQHGDVIIRYEPIGGQQLQFAVETGQNDVPPEFYYAIEFGIAEAISKYKGFRLVGLRAVLIGGSTHLESMEMAFRIAAYLSFQNALEQAVVIPVRNLYAL